MPSEITERDTSIVTARTPLGSQPVASFFFTHGSLAGKEIPLTGDTFFVGRSQSNSLVLADQSVSRKHAVINFLDGKYIISDLNSLKGIYVNGRKIEEVELTPGDIINIGENRMQFRSMSPSGSWVNPSKRGRGVWYFLLFVILGVLIGGGTYFTMQKYYQKKIPDMTLSQIERHYDKGVDYYNREHNAELARAEWKKIMELDPKMRTDFAIKAAKLLKSTEPVKAQE